MVALHSSISSPLNTLEATGDVQTGINLVKRAVEEPLRQIAYNAGLEGSVVVEKVKNTEAGVGFNALTEEYIDMVKAGIVGSCKSYTFCASKCCIHRISCIDY